MKLMLPIILPLAFASSAFGLNEAPPVQTVPAPMPMVRPYVIEGQGKQAPVEPASWLGVITTPLSRQLSGYLGLKPGFGLFVAKVMPDSPAHKAGLMENDLLLRLDDQELVNFEQLAVLVRSKNEGDKIILTVMRKGKEQKVEVVIGKREMPKGSVPNAHRRMMPPAEGGMDRGRLREWMKQYRVPPPGWDQAHKRMERFKEGMKECPDQGPNTHKE